MIATDTHIIFVLLRPASATHVQAWPSAQNGAEVFFNAIGEAELRHGVAVLPAR
jgi:predicted nucleic acid-binding protein